MTDEAPDPRQQLHALRNAVQTIIMRMYLLQKRLERLERHHEDVREEDQA